MPPIQPENHAERLAEALDGQYVDLEPLRGAGMSEVYKATEVRFGRPVVIKLVSRELGGGEALERFRREIALTASLQHPNIVPLLDAGEVDGLPYFVMPFVKGESLRARLQRGPLSTRETASIMLDVSQALALAHENGVVHRDIKPGNVMLTRGRAVVVDFGVAKSIAVARGRTPSPLPDAARSGELTTEGSSLGTPAYMAPEQIAGDPDADHRVDIYALGVVGYEMLAGAPPFRGGTVGKLRVAHLTEAPPPLHTRRADVPQRLSQLIMQCLEKDPEDRPRMATALVRTLESPELLIADADAKQAPAVVAKPQIQVPASPRASSNRFGFIAGLFRDLRYAVRSLLKARGFTFLAVCTLALGIGAATAIFSVVNGVLLRPLPYPDPERVVRVWQHSDEGAPSNFSDPNFQDLRERARSFHSLAQVSSSVVPAIVNDEVLRSQAAWVSSGFLDVFGIPVAAGRPFLPAEHTEGASPVALVSGGYARRFFGGATQAVGQEVRLDGVTYSIVGVLPSSFAFPMGADIWSPRERVRGATSRTAHNWQVYGRVRAGLAVEAASQETDAIGRALKAEHGDDSWMAGGSVVSLHEQMVGHVRPVLLTLLASAVLLLLIACANVVNLLIARLATRDREIAVRLALGAGRVRIFRQFMLETMTLALIAGALGSAIAVWGVEVIVALQPGNIPRLNEVGVDGEALLFALGASIVVAFVLGVLTAHRTGGSDMRGALAANQRSQAGNLASNRMRAGLVMSQVALTTILLVGAGLLGRSLYSLISVDPGYRTSGAVVMNLLRPTTQGEAEPAALAASNDLLLERLAAIPGVEHVGGANDLPLGGGNYSAGTFLVLQRPDEVMNFEDYQAIGSNPDRTGYAAYRVASEDYFNAMRIPIVRGRGFERRDTPEGEHVALVSESLVRERWPNEDPLGKLIQFGNMDGNLRAMTIVGVVGDIRETRLDAEPGGVIYGYSRQRTSMTSRFNWVLAGSGPAEATIASARAVVRELDPTVAPRFRRLEEIHSGSTAERRFQLVLLAVFAGTALLLAVMGIYAVVAYLVSQRTREIGIRMALGARASDVVRMVVRGGVMPALVGLGAGVAIAAGLSRYVSEMLYGVGAWDPFTFGVVVVTLAMAAVLASYVPARRAAGVEPMEALRLD